MSEPLHVNGRLILIAEQPEERKPPAGITIAAFEDGLRLAQSQRTIPINEFCKDAKCKDYLRTDFPKSPHFHIGGEVFTVAEVTWQKARSRQ